MLSRGVAVELDRDAFEAGRWSDKVLQAHRLGKASKESERSGEHVIEVGAAAEIAKIIRSFSSVSEDKGA